MGRQTQLYLLREDLIALLTGLQERWGAYAALKHASSPKVFVLSPCDADPAETLTIFNPRITPAFGRARIAEGIFVVDDLRLPVLELTPTCLNQWEGKPAISHGRIFGNFEPYLGKPPQFVKWYESVIRWIRRDLVKCPLADWNGYMGKQAHEFYLSGGYLLPGFVPARTQVWLDLIAKQHGSAGLAESSGRN